MTDRAQPRQRWGWMDLTRGSAVMLVVAFHSATFMRYAEIDAPAVVTEVNGWFAPFRMPALVFMSGLLAPSSLRKGPVRYVEGKLRHVAWPYAVWTAMFFVVTWPVYNPTGYVLGGTYLWYLLFLLLYYAVALATARVPPPVVAAVALAVASVAQEDDKWGERFWILLFFFMLGATAARAPTVWAWVLASRAVLAAAGVATVVLVVHVATREVVTPTLNGYGPATAAGSAAGVLLIVRLARAVGDSPVLAPLRFAGRHSIVYYVSHVQTVYCVAHLAEKAGASSSWGVYALTLGTSTVLATLCSLIVERHPRWGAGWLFSWRPDRRAARASVVVPASM